MKFTLSWLKDYLDTDAELEAISTTLTAIGLEVEEIEDPTQAFAAFTAAKVISAEQHPDADRLKVLMVDTGAKDPVQIVCGAPNARAGMTGIFAPPGAYIPGLDTVLQKGKIRGVESDGMMVSEREMRLSDEHTGIIDLDDSITVGTPFCDIFNLNDPIIEIAITPNRADAAGIYGIARDLAAAGLGKLKTPEIKSVPAAFETPVTITIEDEEACPLFLGRLIRNVKNGPSPDWLQKRLTSIGLRPISTLVDITNYMTIAMNRPLHVFDADKLRGGITVRMGREGEAFEALNDKAYSVDESMTCVCDESGVLGLGGIIGGTSSGVDENTTNVVIEAALFDPIRTAVTGRKHQINSDARYRFERGIDTNFTADGMEMATQMALDLCGGEAGTVVQAGTVPEETRQFAFDPALTKKLGGIEISEARQRDILETLGFTLNGNMATPPSWRPDILGSADLVEEVLRIEGYDKIPATTLPKQRVLTHSAHSPMRRRVHVTQRALAERGLMESVTWSFMDAGLAKRFEAEPLDAHALTLANPISSDLSRMRPSILPNLIAAAGRNADRGYPNAALFEVGPVFFGVNPADQSIMAAGIRHAQMSNKHWAGGDAGRQVDVFDAKADVMALLLANGFDAANTPISNDAPSWYHPGRSGTLRLGKTVLGWFGEIHPALLQEMDIDGPIVAFEVFLEAIPSKKNKGAAKSLLHLNPLQPLSRDFAFIVDEDVAANDVVRAAQSADKKLIASVQVFDVYQGKGVEEGHKSIAISLTLQPQGKTLSDEELEALSQSVIETVTAKTGGTLR